MDLFGKKKPKGAKGETKGGGKCDGNSKERNKGSECAPCDDWATSVLRLCYVWATLNPIRNPRLRHEQRQPWREEVQVLRAKAGLTRRPQLAAGYGLGLRRQGLLIASVRKQEPVISGRGRNL